MTPAEAIGSWVRAMRAQKAASIANVIAAVKAVPAVGEAGRRFRVYVRNLTTKYLVLSVGRGKDPPLWRRFHTDSD